MGVSRISASGIVALALGTLSGCTVTPASRNYEAMTVIGQPEKPAAPINQATLNRLSTTAGARVPNFAPFVTSIGSLSGTPVYAGNHVELLIDGPATYSRMLESIRSARSYVYLETYIFADDNAGKRFATLLAQKSAQQVNVKVMYDSFGSMRSDNEFFASMEASGIEMIEYNKIDPLEGGNPLRINNRDHRKLLIVDGKVAFTGGVNLSSTYSSQSRSTRNRDPIREGWRDTHIAVHGPAVQGFNEIFLRHWQAQGGKGASHEDASVINASGGEIVAILTAKGGDGEASAIFGAYADAMRVATQRIWITQAYFAPDREFLGLLRQAAQRGVDVRLLVPGVSDSMLVLNASRAKYARLLESGVRIYESQHTLLHAKTAVIDSLWSTVGSSNLDYRSFLHNDEINAIILGNHFADAMEKQFRDDLGQSKEITLDSWNGRSLWTRFKEQFSWAFEYWL